MSIASLGPYGAVLADGSEYRGDYGRTLGEDALLRFHRPRLAALVAAGPDLLACETIPCLAEARALARLLPEFPGSCAWISFSARDKSWSGGAGGEPFAEQARRWRAHGAQLVGCCCRTSPAEIRAIAAWARSA